MFQGREKPRTPRATGTPPEDNEKNFSKPLDIISTMCYNEYTTEEGKPPKPERKPLCLKK